MAVISIVATNTQDIFSEEKYTFVRNISANHKHVL